MKHAFLRRLGALVLALAMAASLCAPAWADDPGTPPTTPGSIKGLELSTRLIVLSGSQPQTLSIVGGDLPADATVTWGSSSSAITVTPNAGDKSLAQVSATGNVSGAKVTATIEYAAATDGTTKNVLDCIVYAGTSPVQAVPDMTVAAGQTATVTVTINANADRIPTINFKSNNPNSAEVEGTPVRTDDSYSNTATYRVTVKGIKEGQADIEMISKEGYPLGSWKVTVTRAIPGTAVENVRITPPTYVMPSGVTSYKLTAIVTPDYATNKKLEWTSSNENVATVDQNGVVTRVGPGTTTITATATDGTNVFGTCRVTVEEAPSALDLTPISATLNLDSGPRETRLTATASGQGSAGAAITWTSSNPSVATVDQYGNVTAVKVGSATITATATFRVNNSNKTISKTCAITVVDDNSTLADKVTLDKEKHSMPTDGTVTLRATVSPANAPVKTITWDSSNKNVATVDQNGKVTAVGPGQTMITATAYGNRGEAICVVTVTPKAESIRLNFAYDNNKPGTNHYEYTFKKNGNDYVNVKAILTPAPPQTHPPPPPNRGATNKASGGPRCPAPGGPQAHRQNPDVPGQPSFRRQALCHPQ